MRTFCLGDTHGNYKGLMQCLERSEFDYENDTLISLGDIVDRGPESFECIEELLKIKNLIAIKGNHDETFLNWINTGKHDLGFFHGAPETFKSYIDHIPAEEHASYRRVFTQQGPNYFSNLTKMDIPESHIKFFENQVYYYIDKDNNCFVHGGFDRNELIEEQDPEDFLWDRSLIKQALSHSTNDFPFKILNNFNEVYIGHTPTLTWKTTHPIPACNIMLLDTGAGYAQGKMTIMEVGTHTYYQSDLGSELYPETLK
jgi:serine/threonine protein phosphatase 1